MGSKYCPNCKEIKPIVGGWHKQRKSKDGLQYWCIKCRKEHNYEERLQYQKERYYLKNDQYLNSSYKRKYGISLDEYKQLLEKQKNVCAICKQNCITGKRLAVDHCHETNVVRGLLCTKCNSLLGQSDSSIEKLRMAILYLENFNAS